MKPCLVGYAFEEDLMYRFLKVVSLLTFLASLSTSVFAADCADDPRTTGVARTIAIDSTGGALLGRLQYKETVSLRRKEVVLTFDDGPHREHTKKILDVLDSHCVKATFFLVGRRSIYFAEDLKEVARRGHTIASHTWSHPGDVSKLPLEEAKVEIEQGFLATAYVLGQPIAPFFRYPGLNHSSELNEYLASRDISVWSVDIVSDDTMHGLTPEGLVNQTMERLRKMTRGILLFHDLKKVTADAMDSFLTQLKLEGYKVVHVVSNSAYQPNPELIARMNVSKRSLQSAAFSMVAPEEAGQDDRDILTMGKVDIMKNEFVHIEASANSSLQEVREIAASQPNQAKTN